MPLTIEKIALELLGLPAESRALLAEKLIESLDEKEDTDTNNAIERVNSLDKVEA